MEPISQNSGNNRIDENKSNSSEAQQKLREIGDHVLHSPPSVVNRNEEMGKAPKFWTRILSQITSFGETLAIGILQAARNLYKAFTTSTKENVSKNVEPGTAPNYPEGIDSADKDKFFAEFRKKHADEANKELKNAMEETGQIPKEPKVRFAENTTLIANGKASIIKTKFEEPELENLKNLETISKQDLISGFKIIYKNLEGVKAKTKKEINNDLFICLKECIQKEITREDWKAAVKNKLIGDNLTKFEEQRNQIIINRDRYRTEKNSLNEQLNQNPEDKELKQKFNEAKNNLGKAAVLLSKAESQVSDLKNISHIIDVFFGNHDFQILADKKIEEYSQTDFIPFEPRNDLVPEKGILKKAKTFESTIDNFKNEQQAGQKDV